MIGYNEAATPNEKHFKKEKEIKLLRSFFISW